MEGGGRNLEKYERLKVGDIKGEAEARATILELDDPGNFVKIESLLADRSIAL